MQLPTLFVDFDGTLVDVAPRYYCLYRELVLRFGAKPLSRSIYWNLRRDGVASQEVCGRTSCRIPVAEFEQLYLDLIEAAPYLHLNRLFSRVGSTLEHLSDHYRLVLVTMRKDVGNLHEELRRKRIASYFDQVLCRGLNRRVTKAEMVRRAGCSLEGAIVVGDSDDDINCAKSLRLLSIAVTSGIRSHEFLSRLRPDVLLPVISELPDYLAQKRVELGR